eukprot:GHVR01132465.1.p1 GENE.GHVR01132465.1~~GHVR01132465.1.p1  ORF type:complete len:175 (+),score=41.16 GHVR01132465.1:53-577(+)
MLNKIYILLLLIETQTFWIPHSTNEFLEKHSNNNGGIDDLSGSGLTTGASSLISTTGASSLISTTGASSLISTTGASSLISTTPTPTIPSDDDSCYTGPSCQSKFTIPCLGLVGVYVANNETLTHSDSFKGTNGGLVVTSWDDSRGIGCNDGFGSLTMKLITSAPELIMYPDVS